MLGSKFAYEKTTKREVFSVMVGFWTQSITLQMETKN